MKRNPQVFCPFSTYTNNQQSIRFETPLPIFAMGVSPRSRSNDTMLPIRLDFSCLAASLHQFSLIQEAIKTFQLLPGLEQGGLPSYVGERGMVDLILGIEPGSLLVNKVT